MEFVGAVPRVGDLVSADDDDEEVWARVYRVVWQLYPETSDGWEKYCAVVYAKQVDLDKTLKYDYEVKND